MLCTKLKTHTQRAKDKQKQTRMRESHPHQQKTNTYLIPRLEAEKKEQSGTCTADKRTDLGSSNKKRRSLYHIYIYIYIYIYDRYTEEQGHTKSKRELLVRKHNKMPVPYQAKKKRAERAEAAQKTKEHMYVSSSLPKQEMRQAICIIHTVAQAQTKSERE